MQELLAAGGELALAIDDLRDRSFLAWDDDGGAGYGAALEFPIPASGDYFLIAGSALSSVGRSTAGDYQLQIGINAAEVLAGADQPEGAAIAIGFRPTIGCFPPQGATAARPTVLHIPMQFSSAAFSTYSPQAPT